MHQRLLSIMALAFIALALLQSLLGGILFWKTIGFSAEQILAHYSEKSFHGLLEVMLPHTLFIGIALAATLHFLAFVQQINTKVKTAAVSLLYPFFLLDQASPIGMMLGVDLFAYVKIVAFVGFELTLASVWVIVFTNTLKELK